MENKKGQVAKIVIFGFIFLILISIVMVLVYVATKSTTPKDNAESEEEIELFLRAKEIGTENYLEVEYILEDITNGSNIVKQGRTKHDSFLPVKVPEERNYKLNCWNGEYYFSGERVTITEREKSLNKSKAVCEITKIGKIEVKHFGDIQQEINKIRINISEIGEGSYSRMGVCFSWSAGIVSAKLKDSMVVCDEGAWLNWTKYDAKNSKYEYLPEGQYRCGENWIEYCEEKDANKCKVTEIEPPSRLESVADHCTTLGKTLGKNEDYQTVIEVKTIDYKNDLDFVDVYIFDTDMRREESTGTFEWMSEYRGQDIGGEDVKHKIAYETI